MKVISVNNLYKEYHTGVVGFKSLLKDIESFIFKLFKKKDPNSALTINNRKKKRRILAINNCSFDLKKGEILGLLGKNGCGKTTLLKIISNVTKPTSGEVKIRGKVSSFLEVGAAFNSELTGIENIYLYASIFKIGKNEIKKKLSKILDFAEISDDLLNTPIKRYSSGMYLKLAMASSFFVEADILILDEVLSVGDENFRRKCINKIFELKRKNKTVIFVSHNLDMVRKVCDRVLVMNNGIIIRDENVSNAINFYLKKIVK
jgi:lipopolysaccharide transport system ATP-binding protein